MREENKQKCWEIVKNGTLNVDKPVTRKLLKKTGGIVQMMIETQIEALKKELNHLIDVGVCFDQIYDLSVKLDKLIVQYYSEVMNIRRRS